VLYDYRNLFDRIFTINNNKPDIYLQT